MSQRFRNSVRHPRGAQNTRSSNRSSRHPSQQHREGNDNVVITTVDAAKYMPRPVTLSKNTVIFDLHGGHYSYLHLTMALEQQFNPGNILSVGPVNGADYCQPTCTMAEVLFATSEARQLSITRGITIEGTRFLAVPVMNDVSYKDVFRFQTPQQGPLNWPDTISEFDTSGTVFMIEGLPLEPAYLMIEKVTMSMENALEDNADVKLAHPVLTIFADTHILSPIPKNTVYIVVHGHVDSFSIFNQPNDQGQGKVHLPAYVSFQGFNFAQFKFDRVFCFNCEKSDCHFTEDCTSIRVARFLRDYVIPETTL